jgi:hypothetical protein
MACTGPTLPLVLLEYYKYDYVYIYIYIYNIEKGKTMDGEYYSNLLTRLDEKNREKRPGLKKK